MVLVSGSGSNMDALAAACERGEVPGRIVAVFADRDCTGIELAKERGIETEVLEPQQYLDRSDWCEALAKRIESYEPDLIVSAGFMRILTPNFVDAFESRLINLHPSLLPAFPGAHAVRDALEAGVDVTGTTVHFVDQEVDHGPVIAQEKVKVEPGDTEESLHERIKAVEHRVLSQVVSDLLNEKRA